MQEKPVRRGVLARFPGGCRSRPPAFRGRGRLLGHESPRGRESPRVGAHPRRSPSRGRSTMPTSVSSTPRNAGACAIGWRMFGPLPADRRVSPAFL